MKKFIFVSLLVSSASFAMNRESGGMMAPAAIYVDFQSLGSGIDTSTLKIFKQYVTYAHSKGLVKEATLESYGYEGEKLACVLFNDYWVHQGFVRKLARWIEADKKTHPQLPKRTKVSVSSRCNEFEQSQEHDLSDLAQ